MLKRTQWGYAANPNLGGVLLVGLGCEVFQIGRMKELYGIEESETFRTMTIQEQRRHAGRRSSRGSNGSARCCRSPTRRSAKRCRRPN